MTSSRQKLSGIPSTEYDLAMGTKGNDGLVVGRACPKEHVSMQTAGAVLCLTRLNPLCTPFEKLSQRCHESCPSFRSRKIISTLFASSIWLVRGQVPARL